MKQFKISLEEEAHAKLKLMSKTMGVPIGSMVTNLMAGLENRASAIYFTAVQQNETSRKKDAVSTSFTPLVDRDKGRTQEINEILYEVILKADDQDAAEPDASKWGTKRGGVMSEFKRKMHDLHKEQLDSGTWQPKMTFKKKK